MSNSILPELETAVGGGGFFLFGHKQQIEVLDQFYYLTRCSGKDNLVAGGDVEIEVGNRPWVGLNSVEVCRLNSLSVGRNRPRVCGGYALGEVWLECRPLWCAAVDDFPVRWAWWVWPKWRERREKVEGRRQIEP